MVIPCDCVNPQFTQSFWMVMLMENVYQVRQRLQDFVILNVTKKETWEAYPGLKPMQNQGRDYN